ncbi:MAG: hypothetical protein KC910_20225 [Candidatus Eremiobacteraeota bacterium]|nr:hypothetical protein [Candidatus Eremiobacteraeota bacterium]
MAGIFLLDGPSGAGKTTITQALLEHFKDRLGFCQRVTTRAQREGETGSDYQFIDAHDFESRLARGEFAAYRKFEFGMSYALPKQPVDEMVQHGRHALAMIDLGTVGMARKCWPSSVAFFLITPPDELEARLKARGAHTHAQIVERVENARQALEFTPFYDYVIPNRQGCLEKTLDRVIRILSWEMERVG